MEDIRDLDFIEDIDDFESTEEPNALQLYKSYQKQLKGVENQLENVHEQIQELQERQQLLLVEKRQIKKKLTDLKRDEKRREDSCADWSSNDWPWSEQVNVLKTHQFGIEGPFRKGQLEAINATMKERDCFVVMPTGGGKSLTYMIPSCISKGITLVVSPLLSLMQDQVSQLNNRFNVRSEMLSRSLSRKEVNALYKEFLDEASTLRCVYVTPEKIAKNQRFRGLLQQMYERDRLARIVIDEVHCCSQWGHDFRPDYKKLGFLKQQFPSVPLMALTATAPKDVEIDVKKILRMEDPLVFRSSFNRTNLHYEVREKPVSAKALIDDIYKYITEKFPTASGIIYTFSKREANQVKKDLITKGLLVETYHADMPDGDRTRVYQQWTSNRIKIVVATIAFGMGIDKSDVRFIIHHSMAKSLTGYYQQSGRAGRDGKLSHCLVYYRPADIARLTSLACKQQHGISKLYEMVKYCTTFECRRISMSRHFKEKITTADCNFMCDNCNCTDGVRSVDVSELAKQVINVCQYSWSIKNKLTLLQMVTILRTGKLKKIALDPKMVSKVQGMKKKDIEDLLVHMLIEDVLEQKPNHTAYTVNVYLKCGYKAKGVSKGVPLAMDKRDDDTKKKAAKTPEKKKKSERKPEKEVEKEEKEVKEDKQTNKRNVIHLDLLSDSDDSDCEDFILQPRKKKRKVSPVDCDLTNL